MQVDRVGASELRRKGEEGRTEHGKRQEGRKPADLVRPPPSRPPPSARGGRNQYAKAASAPGLLSKRRRISASFLESPPKGVHRRDLRREPSHSGDSFLWPKKSAAHQRPCTHARGQATAARCACAACVKAKTEDGGKAGEREPAAAAASVKQRPEQSTPLLTSLLFRKSERL